jgi:hypothetical protein
MSCCNRLAEIESRLTQRDKIDEDTRWLLEQVRSWQNWAGRVVEYGGLIDLLRSEKYANVNIHKVIIGYDELFCSGAFGH